MAEKVLAAVAPRPATHPSRGRSVSRTPPRALCLPLSSPPPRHHIYGPLHDQLTSPPERHCRRRLHSRGLASPLRQLWALLVRCRLREVLPADLHRERALLLVRDGRRVRPVHHRDGNEPVPEQRQRPVVSDRRRHEPVRLLVPLRHHGSERGAG
jgi:hypothetical protein